MEALGVYHADKEQEGENCLLKGSEVSLSQELSRAPKPGGQKDRRILEKLLPSAGEQVGGSDSTGISPSSH